MKKVLTALLAAGALVTLAACGGNSNDSNGSGSGSNEKVTLKFQSLAFQKTTVAATKKIVADWNAANPNIQVEYVQGSWDSVHDQLVTQFQGGTAPDIIHDESADITGFINQGYLADISKYLSQETKDAVSQGVWDTVSKDGKVYAAPTLLQSYVVFANSNLLKQAGITATGDSLSWDDLAADAKKLTAAGKYGLGWGLKSPTATMLNLGLNFDAKFFDGTGQDAKATIGDAELEVPKRIHAMAYTDKSIDPTSLTQSGSDVLPGFYAGKYGMIVAGNYVAQQIAEEAPKGFQWEVLPPLKGTSSKQAANPQTLSVPAEGKHIEQSAKFIDYFMKAENLAAVGQGDWLIPTTQGARDAIQKATGGKNGWQQTLASGTELTKAPFQSVQNYPKWKDQIATPAFQEFLANKTDAAALGKKLSDGWGQVNQ
ncbi:ABC transporter substrate-binding protein [Kribbella solani]|uniref:ABC-type glycerol-3-phosphate transport system substrate-binding protein n=1 Tax=Kribbella solani TaxID=236067 RepID=A0A841DIA3_9ACTN|nr:sugar ABC transporter substrate-binding protein [Kribbella solani]MBB5977249.1 ABC-type glycerol-3-phosphate transport system substrate-binding protein [Kribbella solani]MDX2974288.1 sugar ABC transporter substrate-binding protein [Kribbella solani]MDX3002058.1 sugar ABC transporter substrate-binding protein [Kribbella solani]